MFRINKEKNIVESLEEVTFSELGYREQENLQGLEPGLGRIDQDWQYCNFTIL